MDGGVFAERATGEEAHGVVLSVDGSSGASGVSRSSGASSSR